MKKVLLVVFCLTIIFSCKEEDVKKNDVLVETVKPSKLSVVMEYTSDTTDKVQMLFAQIELRNGKNAMFLLDDKVKDSKEVQKLKFEMYDDLIPFVVQLKLGSKPKQLKIEKIVASYEKKEILIDGADLNKYFALNNYVSFDAETKTITTKKINGKHLPHITLRRGFIKRLFNLQ